MGINKETHCEKTFREWETLEHLVLNGMPLLNHPHVPGSYTVEEAESLEELEVMYNSKKTVSSKHNRTDVHRNS